MLASRPRLRQILVLALAASAGSHAALVPAHAADTTVAAGFALSVLALAIVALVVDRSDRPGAAVAAALLLASLLLTYAATRVAVVWPLAHAEPVDAIGAVTKLVEAAGLMLAVRLAKVQAGGSRLSVRHEGAGP
jgi:hypothetical protein